MQIYDVLALPTSSRWGHTLIGVYVDERAPQYNLLDANIRLKSILNQGTTVCIEVPLMEA